MNIQIENTAKELISTGNKICSSKLIYDVGRKNGLQFKVIGDVFITDANRVSRGKYDVSRVIRSSDEAIQKTEKTHKDKSKKHTPAQQINLHQSVIDEGEVYIPEVDETYVPWGDFNEIKNVISSKMFFPVYISGLSGNGKTMMVEQACAKLKREYVRIQITPETDETDLIGHFSLINGETVFCKGPVVRAMEEGAVCLIDEIDRGSNKIMCLQSVLEGKPVLLKKIGEVVKPKLGFNILATANTMGRGSEDGRFSAATMLDEAFLERFVNVFEQHYPENEVEKKIILKLMESLDCVDDDFASKLVAWAQIIRKTYEEEAVDEVISTRRLCHIVKTFYITRNRAKSIARCISRFDEDTRAAFNDLYTKIDDTQE